jgi:hypothetical protein
VTIAAKNLARLIYHAKNALTLERAARERADQAARQAGVPTAGDRYNYMNAQTNLGLGGPRQ